MEKPAMALPDRHIPIGHLFDMQAGVTKKG